mmetsp:Transcript_5090/g.10800  ORF Transcript_5090/g.10800 Transcript_5090/m.10800 type:complete len:391 (+) Transcript_5090:177-1349(+)
MPLSRSMETSNEGSGTDRFHENEAQRQHPLSRPSSTSASPSSLQIFALAATFFGCMIIMELAMEAASTSYSYLDSLTSAITLFQFGFCVALPAIVEGPRQVLKTFPRNRTELSPYIWLSLAVFGATALATHSLHYVSYPTKVVFKSAKLIPVMVVATFMNPSKKFGSLDYISAAMLCTGAAGYSYGSGKDGQDSSTSFVGVALLTASIVCDAIVPNFQQKLMAPPAGTVFYTGLPTAVNGAGVPISSSASPSRSCCDSLTGSADVGGLGLTAAELMVNVNAVGFLCLLIYMILSGSLVAFVTTAISSPMLLVYLTVIGLGLSIAVFAYTRLIKSAGSVVAVAVATLRKVATVVLSYILFPKALLRIHVFSGLLVLSGILLNAYTRQRGRR